MAANETSDRTVVVGVDGSDGSSIALEWALDKAAQFGQVRTVTSYQIAPLIDSYGAAYSNLDVFRESAEAQLRSVLEATDPDLFKHATIVQSHAGTALVQASADAALLVVGSRGRSALAETLLGSVGSYCVKHSKVPVAVIPEDTQTQKKLDKIAVGIDGSENSNAALRWACDNADPEGTVVAVGSFNPVWSSFDGYVPDIDALERGTRKMVEDVVAEVAGNTETGPKIELDIRCGDPRTELRSAGEDADLLVIGARGHRGVSHLLTGSVTTSLLHHPTGPTVVVPY